ncbi:MAG: extracellular solute-binding protein [Burkholderiales bacterium]|jgi:microcin C transport system substrate-binding protein
MRIVSRWVAGIAASLALVGATPFAVAASGATPSAVAASGAPAAASGAAEPATPGAFVHGMAWGAQTKYPAGFRHFDYVNPEAPRGGTLTLDGFGSYDKLNPFTLKGVLGAGVGALMFDTLTEQADDEPFSVYGLLAESMSFAPDGLSITFRLNPKARFSNGDPVLAADVKHTFDTLMGKGAHPRYKNLYGDVKAAVVVDERTVRFDFKRRNHELHMILGGLPVFSRKWGEGKPFDQIVQEPPIASGPYTLERADWGRSIAFKRRADYWAEGLPVRRGMYNFERVVYKYFKDEVARLEGFKAGQFDWIFENSAKNWARGHAGPKYRSGELQKKAFEHSNSAGIQGFAMNTRRSLFADRRVRLALAQAFDFEWMNRQVFYGQYVRSPSYFTNSEMEAKGPPGPDELALLEPLRDKLDPSVFGPAPLPPDTVAPATLRDNLRTALALLKEAGWTVADDGIMRNAKGEPFEFEVLSYSKALERIAVPWARNLEKLGIRANLRVTDPVLFQKRLDEFEFDVTVVSFPASQTPGNELLDRFGTAAADEKGSDNAMAVRDPAVDALIRTLLSSGSRAELVTAAKALDRVLRSGWYLVPHFYVASHRVAYRDVLAYPQTLPKYYSASTWLLKTWWFKPGTEAR